VKKTLLFVTYGGGHAHMIYPVIHALRASAASVNYMLDIRVLGLTSAKSILNANGLDCFGFADYLDKKKDRDAIVWGTALAADHHSPTIGVTLAESVAYLGLNYKDLVIRLGEYEAERVFKEKARQAFYPLTIMDKIFDDIKPDFVITTNSPRSEAAAIETANKRGIDNLIICDLFTGMGDYKLKGRNITFLNEFAQKMFAADGLIDDKISTFYCTGNPAFDKILSLPKEKNPEWIKQHFPQAGNKALVLHADMPGYWDYANKRSHIKSETENLAELDACYQATMDNNAFYLIRPHPSQNRVFYSKWLENRSHASLAAECNLHKLLANIDLLIARTTTVALEAIIMHKKFLQLDAAFHKDLPLASMLTAWGVNGYSELRSAITNALTNEKEFQTIKQTIKQWLPAEPASAKIAAIILKKVGLQ